MKARLKLKDAPIIDVPSGIYPVDRNDWRNYMHGGYGILFSAVLGYVVLAWKYPTFGAEPSLQTMALGMVVGAVAMILFGWDRRRTQMQQQRLKERYPNEPWTWDFLNNELSIFDGVLKRAAMKLLGAFGIVIASLPLCWAFYWGNSEAIGVPFLCIAMNVVAAGIAMIAVYEMFVLRKFGSSRLEFRRFPFRLGSILDVRLKTTRAFGKFERLKVTLVCVREDVLHQGQEEQETVFRELYRDTVRLTPEPNYDPSVPLDLALILELPTGEFGTRIDSVKPRYWILNAVSEGPGLDYSAAFRVPIYA